MATSSRRRLLRPIVAASMSALAMALIFAAAAAAVELHVSIMACGEGQAVVPDDSLTTDDCPPVIEPADDPGDPPADHVWLFEPILASTQILVDDGVDQFSRADTVWSGETPCREPSTCFISPTYTLEAQLQPGMTIVAQLTYPSGAKAGSAFLRGTDLVGPIPLTIAADGSVSFDTTGAEFRHVIFVNNLAAPPVASTEPTTPPTSTARSVVGGDTGAIGPWLALAVVGSAGFLATVKRGPRRR
jgi:hypothetical protein